MKSPLPLSKEIRMKKELALKKKEAKKGGIFYR